MSDHHAFNVLFLCTGNSARSERQAAFVTAFRYLKNRIDTFVNLPLRSIDKLSLGTKLREIGRADGATHSTPKAG